MATGTLMLPHREVAPLRSVLRRLWLAVAALGLAVLIVWLDRKGYRDAVDDSVTLLDAVYYSTVSLSTTGYGDITPATPEARLVNALLITPLRIFFLIVLVGTTVEVLTERTREEYRLSRWRSRVNNHTLVIGYGTKGRAAVRSLLADGYPKERILVIEDDQSIVAQANVDGLAAVLGDATRREVLERAEIGQAERVLISTARDDTAVLVVLTVRQLNTTASVISAVRESENAPLLRQSGANNVVVSSEAAGRLLALSSTSPATGAVLDDLLAPQQGLEVGERLVRDDEVGGSPKDCDDMVLAVLRGGELMRYAAAAVSPLQAGDRLITVHDERHPSPHDHNHHHQRA